MSKRAYISGWAVASALALFLAGPLSAQVDAESFAKLGFNFNPPGAQSAALGGAYIALAKDATAAETNPAGLTVLLDPEVAFEFKAVEYTRTLPVQAGGGEFKDEVAVPSFASVVVPSERITFAAFRHELVSYRNTVWSQGYDRGGGIFLNPFTSVLDLQVVNWGGALAYQASSTLSIGVSGGISQLKMLVDFPRYRVAQFNDAFLRNRLFVDESLSAFFVNAGLLVQANEQVTLGAVYKLRGEFADVPYQLTERSASGTSTTRTVNGGLNVPDQIGAGLAIRPNDRFTLSIDAVYTMYSQLSENTAVIFSNAAASDYVADDGLDVHAGGELLFFVGQTPLAIRAGVARVAPSNVYYTGNSSVERGLWGTEPTDAQLQFSGGFGLVLGRRVGFDTAVSVGDERMEGVASLQIFLGGN